MNMDSAVKPPQPSRLLQILQPWIVKVYRVAGMVALGAILVGLIVFLTGTIFWYFNRTWVRPVILSPEHVKVSAATNALHDAQARLSDTTFKLLVAHDELARLDLLRDDGAGAMRCYVTDDARIDEVGHRFLGRHLGDIIRVDL